MGEMGEPTGVLDVLLLVVDTFCRESASSCLRRRALASVEIGECPLVSKPLILTLLTAVVYGTSRILPDFQIISPGERHHITCPQAL